ncbi:MAG: SusC/RagA family TonB-linked outer membrane protein [Gemmatimonadaceae bacterium]|nr:SusC/RagA family TonB-linked outer membrane protein [Gemmatimonadaceae bacterium]
MRFGRYALVAAMLALGVPLAAQQTAGGAIVGRVTDRVNGQPITDVRVQIVGTQRGGLTRTNGTYRIVGVPNGTYTVRASRIGFAAATATATVSNNGEATANLALGVAENVLDKVTVSGATGGTARAREVGASVSRIDSTSFNVAAVTNLSQVLSARTPGVTVQAGGGTIGVSNRIRLRGPTSINLSNDPLLVIDGLVSNNNTSNFAVGVGGATTSRLDDINPQDIEDIQVLKGAAATALYGTGAANGVIQITTKRGKAGKARWGIYTEAGSDRTLVPLNDPLMSTNYRQIGRLATPGARGINGPCSLEAQVLRTCVSRDTLYTNSPFANLSPFRVGSSTRMGVNVNGGSEQVQYYLGGELSRQNGIVGPSGARRTNLRANIGANLTSKIRADVTMSYLKSVLNLPINDNAFAGVLSAGLLGGAFDCTPQSRPRIFECNAGADTASRGYVTANVPVTQYFAQSQQQDVDRLQTGVTFNYTPLSWLQSTLRAGGDFVYQYDQQLIPPNKIFLSAANIEGSRFQARAYRPTYTVTANTKASYDLTSSIRLSTLVGSQYTNEANRFTSAFGAVLLPGTSSLSGANARFAVNEANSQIVTIAGVLEQTASFNDRLFVTAAARMDNSSVFGAASRQFVFYPSVSTSYVISEEKWFPKFGVIDQLRLRGSIGEAGNRPTFRQSETFFNSVSVNAASPDASLPAVTIGGPVGNALLKPEITRETEGGFDFNLKGGRIDGEFTVFRKDTRDLLVGRVLAPSLGVAATQNVNLSRMTTKGLEGTVNVKVIDNKRFSYAQRFTVTTFANEIAALGRIDGQPIAPIIQGTQQFRAGYPAGGYFQRKILSYTDRNADGIISRVNCPAYGGQANPILVGGGACEIMLSDSLEYLGSPLPTRQVSFQSDIRVAKNLQFNVLVDYRGGSKLYNNTREFRNNGGFADGPDFWDIKAPLSDQVKSAARAMGTSDGYIEDASFVRLSELSMTWVVPAAAAKIFKTGGLSLTLAGRNLGLWSNYTGFDPEVLSNPGNNFGTVDFLTNPPSRSYTLRVNFNF